MRNTKLRPENPTGTPAGAAGTPAEIKGGPIVVRVSPRIGDIVDRYLENLSREVGSLADALARGEFEHIRNVAHDLVGTGGSFGFEDMSLIDRSLESAALNQQCEQIELLIEDLAEYLSRVEIVYQ
jgi:HPt (histidine-containing phosphotransfer) domain-containing protein